MHELPPFLRESLAYERDSETACHAELAMRLNIDIWFADPYAPWQRGRNETRTFCCVSFCAKEPICSMSAKRVSKRSAGGSMEVRVKP